MLCIFLFYGSSDAGDLLDLVAELKHSQCRLRGQNSSLLRSISQCEETNLQLMMDVSELRSKLARCCIIFSVDLRLTKLASISWFLMCLWCVFKLLSAQMFAGRARSLAEELDETRRALRESQEKTSRAQANGQSLVWSDPKYHFKTPHFDSTTYIVRKQLY